MLPGRFGVRLSREQNQSASGQSRMTLCLYVCALRVGQESTSNGFQQYICTVSTTRPPALGCFSQGDSGSYHLAQPSSVSLELS